MKYLKRFNESNESKEDFPYYLGCCKYSNEIDESDILYAYVYKSEPKIITRRGEEQEVLDFKMKIDKDDLYFEKTEKGVEVWSKIDQGDHYKNETSIICKSKKDSLFKGDSWRGMILKED
jgi:hypothetical protein